jgi:predicted dinucleotide-binding enzyme
MFICGNDDPAKKTVIDILTSFGWETEDMGKVEAARAIDLYVFFGVSQVL